MKALLMILALATPALAEAPATAAPEGAPDPIEQVERLSKEGAKLYRARSYKDAVLKYQAAYDLIPEPNLLYNIGRCHEHLGDLDAARARYEEMIADSKTSPIFATKGRQRLELLKAASAASPPIPEVKPQGREGEAVVKAVEPPPPPPPHTDLELPAWIATGTGAALLVGGLAVYALGAGDHGDVEDAQSTNTPSSMTRVEAQDLKDSGESKKQIGVGLLVSGAVVGAIGGLLFALDEDPQPAEGKVELKAGATPDGIHFGFGGRF